MKIAFFCNEYPPQAHGGIGVFVKMTAQRLHARGNCVTVVEFGKQPGVRDDNGVAVISLRRSTVPKIGWLLDRFRLWFWLSAAIKMGKIDIFELPEFEGWLPFPILYSKSSSVIVRLHQSATALAKIDARRPPLHIFLCEYFTLWFHKDWIAVSNFVLGHTREIFGVTPRASSVIHNSVTIAPQVMAEIAQLPMLPGPYFLFVGSWSARKGVLAIAKAAKEILALDSSVRFIFIGPETAHDGRPISATVVEIVGDVHRDRVKFFGRFSHNQSLYWMSHALAVVLPSQLEAFSLVPLEAMALGTPAVFTSGSSGTEVINDGVDGFLVSPDDVDLLRTRMVELLVDPQLRLRLSTAASESVKRFSSEAFIDRCESVYMQMGHF
jgi:glycosyltransferase involved in cell wall biosynthesis